MHVTIHQATPLVLTLLSCFAFLPTFSQPASQPASQPQQQSSADALDLLWPTPVLKMVDATAAESNKALRKLILRLARTQPGVTKTNLGGWQSDTDFFERTESAVRMLRTRAYHSVFRYLQGMAPRGSVGKFEVSIGSAWANVNNQSHSNSPHLHPGVQISGVYYVDDGGAREEGIRFVDPRPQASMVPVPARWMLGMGEHVRVNAAPGLFALFPAWLQHYTVAHVGSQPRISVSFNVRITYPEGDAAAGFVGASVSPTGSTSSASAAAAAPKLSFTVPPHHQRDFLDASLARDMVVG